ncbi:Nonribosomal peptide synthase sidE, partial [Colletotrichum shisoi]
SKFNGFPQNCLFQRLHPASKPLSARGTYWPSTVSASKQEHHLLEYIIDLVLDPSLRASLQVDAETGSVFVQVSPRIEMVTSNSSTSINDDTTAHLAYDPGEEEEGTFKAILRFRRVVLDSTSLDMVKTDFVLILSGLLPMDRLGFASHSDYVNYTKNCADSASFWEQMLASTEPSSALAAPLSSEPVETRSRSHMSFQPSKEFIKLLTEVHDGNSRETLVECIWAIVLAHHGNSQDVVFGVVGRDDSFPGAKGCVGCLDQTYLLRVGLSDQSSLREIAESVESFKRRAAGNAFVGLPAILQHLPQGQIVESVLNYSPGSTYSCLAPGLRKFPLVMSVCVSHQPMITMSYIVDIPDQDAQTILDHFAAALVSAFSRKDASESLVKDIQLISEAERSFLLSRPSITPSATPPILSELVETSVSCQPSRTAVVFEDSVSLTYEELNSLANGLGRLLNLSKGDVVPLLMDRSANLCVVILALLKAGVTYTILDPEMPRERNAQIIQECDPSLILADKRYFHMFPLTRSVENCLSEAIPLSTPDNGWNMGRKPGPSDIAYIIYTSGSTGKPKGTAVSHRAAAYGIMQHPPLDDTRRVLLFYSPTASAAQRTFISTLVKGGTIVLASREMILTDLADVINKHQVDDMEITPTALSLLKPSKIPNIKQITIAGESIPQALVDLWAANPRLLVRNRYGSSECTQMSLGRRLRPGDNPRNLGAPADTTLTYILQPGSNELAGRGVAGELCLSGPQLASGYLKEPGLTEKAFVPNPFCTGDDLYKRLYRTGDRARKLADGSIEILGRIDWQLKINGNKVEPADVDQAVTRHQSVAACATFAAEIGKKLALIAVVVPKDGSQPWSQLLPILRKHALSLLPSYMVPSLWMRVDELPRTANGKVDLKSLRGRATELGVDGFSALVASESHQGSVITDEVERKIAAAWASAIGVDDKVIGRQQSFLALGGTSLSAMRAISELREQGIIADFVSLLTDQPLEQVARMSIASSVHRMSYSGPFSLLEEADDFLQSHGEMDIVDAYPATSLQAALLSTLNTDGDPYTQRRVWHVGHLDLGKLKYSFSRVFELSDMLRTGFVPRGRSTILQVVRGDLSLPWAESQSSLEEYIKRDSETDLPMSGPLFRVGIVRGTWLVVTMHHSLCDFWSHGFLYQDVSSVYHGRAIAKRPGFGGYIRFLQGQDVAAAETFWAAHLADAPGSRLNQAPVGESATEIHDLELDLHSQSNRLGVTAGAVVNAAWAMVLSRHLGSRDVVFATTLSGRDAPVEGIESMNGPTIATVPQRIVIDGEKTLISLVKDVCMANYAATSRHAHVGMQGALRAAGLSSDVFDTAVNLLFGEDEPRRKDATAPSIFERQGERPMWSVPYVLLEVIPSGRFTRIRMAGDVEPRRLRFLRDSFSSAVTAILEKPEQSVTETHILGNAELCFLRDSLSNRETLVTPPPRLLQAEFEACAEASPDRVAIEWADAEQCEQVTYAALDRRANCVARLLAGRGLRPGDRAAMMLDKSVDSVVCLLGILKAGLTYVPLGPGNPAARNAFICRDVSARIVILMRSQCDFSAHLPGDVGILVVEDLPSSSTEEHAEPLAAAVTPEQLAYILYTSGSTGQPKGVMVSHRAVATAIRSTCAVEGRASGGEWRCLQMANYTFDVSIMEIFCALGTGATLCMAPIDHLLSDLGGYIRQMRVNHACLTTTVVGLLRPSEAPSLKTLTVGGEPMTKAVVDTWAPACRLLNSYGPTEASIQVSTKEVSSDERAPAGNIGRPFPTVMAVLLDHEEANGGSRLCPYGAVGELCVAGPQLAEGYVGRDDLTAAAFVWSEALQMRLYRTGDLARWLPGGELECLGRKDGQIKIHGQRVELGEVESAMRLCDRVVDATVMLLTISGKPQLVAACVFRSSLAHAAAEEKGPAEPPMTLGAAEEHKEDFQSLRQQITSLASYMLPKFVLPASGFPLLPSLKVDRKALRAMVEKFDAVELSPYVFETNYDAHEVVPAGNNEEKLIESAWSEILNVPCGSIGREANFLSLGGDSVSAINLSSIIRQKGYSLPVPVILSVPKLRDQASQMKLLVRDASRRIKPVFKVPDAVKHTAVASGLDWEEDVDYVYPCPPGQAEFLSQGSRPEQGWVLHTVRRMPAVADQDKWIGSTSVLTERNDILRTCWLRTPDSGWVGLVLRSSQPNVTRVSCQNEEEAASVAASVWHERTWDLITKMDHAVYDGTLLRIWDDHYSAILRRQPEPRHTTFMDFAFHIFELDKSTSLEYWRERLNGWAGNDPAGIRAPWANASAPLSTAHVKRPIRATNVDQLAGDVGVTPAVVLQGAFQIWLSRAMGSHDVAFDYLLTGRNVDLPDPQTINGTTANFLPMRIDVGPKDSLASFLLRTQKDFWAMTDHGDVGLDDIYKAAGLDRKSVGNRLLFLYQPFDPAPTDDPNADYRWHIMAKCKVRMPSPYALSVAIHKAPGKTLLLQMSYDKTLLAQDTAEAIADEIVGSMETVMGVLRNGTATERL